MVMERETNLSSFENKIEDAWRAIDVECKSNPTNFYGELCPFARQDCASNMRKHVCIIKKSLRIAKTFSMLQKKSVRIFDLFVSVVDNYGDM